MLTTVVGSYPPIHRPPSSWGEKISSLLGSYDPLRPALELAVQDQIKAGVDLISDGQVREDMLGIFAKAIPGMAVENKTPKILGKIKPAPYSIGASDLNLALKTVKNISLEFKSELQILEDGKFQDSFKGVKGIITGPTTLALSSRIEGFYDKDKKEDAIIDLAWALKKEVETLQDTGAAVIQIDEPFLSTGVPDMKTAKKAVEIITKDLSRPVSMHVCGPVVEILDELLRFEVDIIDCEFAGQPMNLEALNNINLRGKKIGLGCIDTKTNEVESRDQVDQIINQGIDMVGGENLIADPDCGMRMRSRDAAFSKLKVMVEAVKWLS